MDRRQKYPGLAAALLSVVLGCLLVCCGRSDEEGRAAQSALRALHALPYVSWVFAKEDRRGLVTHLRGKASPGLNFFNYATHNEAHLLDMNGKLLHTWMK